MNFCVSTVAYFKSKGLDTTDWLKSKNGLETMAIVNLIEPFIPEYAIDKNIKVYVYLSDELATVLNSKEWNG